MKWFLVFGFCFLTGCVSQTAAPVSVNSSNQNNSANQSASNHEKYLESQRINKENLEKLEIRNEKFTVVPEDFKQVDFENFTFPTVYPKRSVILKNGEHKYETYDKETGGRGDGWFNLGDVYFVDLTGDEKKEALVFLWRVDCGVSCDGGAALIYIFGADKQIPKLLWRLETGGLAYECGVKTFTVREKKINFDVYADCIEKNRVLAVNDGYTGAGKTYAYGTTEFIVKFNGKKFVGEKIRYTTSEKTSHQNIRPEISIND